MGPHSCLASLPYSFNQHPHPPQTSTQFINSSATYPSPQMILPATLQRKYKSLDGNVLLSLLSNICAYLIHTLFQPLLTLEEPLLLSMANFSTYVEVPSFPASSPDTTKYPCSLLYIQSLLFKQIFPLGRIMTKSPPLKIIIKASLKAMLLLITVLSLLLS